MRRDSDKTCSRYSCHSAASLSVSPSTAPLSAADTFWADPPDSFPPASTFLSISFLIHSSFDLPHYLTNQKCPSSKGRCRNDCTVCEVTRGSYFATRCWFLHSGKQLIPLDALNPGPRAAANAGIMLTDITLYTCSSNVALGGKEYIRSRIRMKKVA